MTEVSLEELNALIPAITDAGFDPGKWDGVLESIRKTVDLGVVSIVAHYFNGQGNDAGADWSYTTWDNPSELEPYVDYFFQHDPMLPITHLLPDGDCVRVQEMLTERDWIESEFFQDFQSKCGMVDFASVKMNGAGKNFFELPIADTGRGGLSEHKVRAINFLAPHLATAIEMNTALGMKFINTAYGPGGVVEQLKKPCFVLDGTRKIIEANQSGLALLQQQQSLFRDSLGVLRLADPRANSSFTKQLGQLANYALFGGQTSTRRKQEKKSTINATDLSGRVYLIQLSTLPQSITRTPLPSGNGWPAIIVIVEPLPDTPDNSVEHCALTHSLTPAETRLLETLVEGCSLREASELLERTYNTVRSQLKNIFLKTNTNSQSQLISIVHKGSGNMAYRPSD